MSGFRLLLRLEIRRLSDAFRHPRAGAWAAVALPAALAAGGLWAAGAAARPDLTTGDGEILLGALVSAPVAVQAYSILFRADDDAFLRRLGIAARATFGVRALRLAALALLTVLAVLIPFISTAQPVFRPLAVALVAAWVGWAVSLWALARAAERTMDPAVKPGLMAKSMKMDPDLVSAGALVFAPIFPVVAGALAARTAGGEGGAGVIPGAVLIVITMPLPWLAARRFERALPRFAPHAGELAYAPPPDATGSELVLRRGAARLLPRRAGAARARDAVVVDRRYRWAARLVWPVAIVSTLALLRAGGSPAVRGSVTTACGLLLIAQSAAVIAAGRAERGRTRWLDRALGVRTVDRLVGRWAAAFGLSFGLALPVALGWAIGVPGGGGWGWMAVAAAMAALASAASLAAAGR